MSLYAASGTPAAIAESRRKYLRPLVMGVLAGWFAEAMFVLVQGHLLFPGKPLMNMVIWGFYCGFGMGAGAGLFILLFVTDRFTGKKAIFWGTLAMAVPFNLCSYYCYQLALNTGYYGASEMGILFVYKNLALSLTAGVFLAWILLSDTGNRWLSKVGL